jgi:hypothetical protein
MRARPLAVLIQEAKSRANDGTCSSREQIAQIGFVYWSLILAMRFVVLMKWGQSRLGNPIQMTEKCCSRLFST